MYDLGGCVLFFLFLRKNQISSSDLCGGENLSSVFLFFRLTISMDPSGAVIHLMKFFEERAQRQIGGIPWNFLTSMFFSVHFRTSTALRRFDLSEIMTATRIMIHSNMILFGASATKPDLNLFRRSFRT